MRRWLANRFPAAPFNRAVDLDIDDTRVTLTRRSRLRSTFPWSHLERVSIRTTDKGPFDDDVFIVLYTAKSCFWVPQAIAAPLLSRLQQLPGFDNESVIEAMSCVENKAFVCWTRDNTA